VKRCDVALLRAMAKHIDGDGLDVFEFGNADFERHAAVAKPRLGAACAVACTGTNLTLTAEGRAANEARACGTCAPLSGEQAAEGQTARLSDSGAPRCKAIGK